MPGPILIQPQQGGPAPLAYELAPGQTIEPTLATAVFDGTSAAGPFVPTIAFYAQNGRLQGRAPCGTVVQPGDVAEVSFFPFAPPIVEGGGGSGFDDLILSLRPAAFYKLNESLGLIAHDSSGNGFDANAAGASSAPIWNQPAAPPGQPSAGFVRTPANTVVANTSFPDLSGGDLTAAGWIFQSVEDIARMLIQGDAITTTNGWELYRQGPTGLPANTPTVGVVNSGTETDLPADAPTLLNNWYLLGARLQAGTWNIFVNGVKQTNTLALTPSSHTGINIGSGVLDTIGSTALFSYLTVFDYALTDLEMLRLFRGF